MSQKQTVDSLSKKSQFRYNFGNIVTVHDNVTVHSKQPPKFTRPEGRILPGYLDDQTLVLTPYLHSDHCPRLRFCTLKEIECRSQAIKNSIIDSYYPTIECEYSEDLESQKSNLESLKTQKSLNTKEKCLQSNVTDSFDSKTFTIYSCKSDSSTAHKSDNPQPEGDVGPRESIETFLGPECFSQLYKRIEKLEERLQLTLESSIQSNSKNQKKLKSVHKLFRMASGILENKDEPKEASLYSDNPDTENELQSIKRRLYDLEKKLIKQKTSPPREYLESRTSKSFILDEESWGRSRVNLKESDFTEPLYSDTDSYFPKKWSEKMKKKKEEKPEQVKQTFLSKCKIPKRKKRNAKITDECGNIEKEFLDDDMITQTFPVNVIELKPDNDMVFGCEWKKKNKEKIKGKKNRNLCKKNSKTNIFTEEIRNLKENPPKHKSINSCVAHKIPKELGHGACVEGPDDSLTFLPENFFHSCCRGCRTSDFKFQKPLDFFKREKNLKLPVLFEEILGKPKSLSASSKTSKVKMRFVLIHKKKDPLAMLKKFVKKLPQTDASKGKSR